MNKKILSVVIAVALCVCMVSPLTIKASNDDMYYITYQANIGVQGLVDSGYVQENYSGAKALFMTNDQIESCNSVQLPVDLSEWDYYVWLGSNTWQGDTFSSFPGGCLLVYNSDDPLLMWTGRPLLRDNYADSSYYVNGQYNWNNWGSICIFDEHLQQMVNDGDLRYFIYVNDQFEEQTGASLTLYEQISMGLNGNFIVSTNVDNYYYLGDISKNSTKTVTNYYIQSEVLEWFFDGIEHSPNYMNYFKVTKDGVTYEDWENAYGDPELDLERDSSLAFASCDCTPIKDGYNPLTNGYAEWTIDTGSFDFTFGGDQMKQTASMNKWGVSFDVAINYRIVGTNGNHNIASTGATGTIYSHIDDFNLSEEDFLNGEYIISLSDLVMDANSYSGGDAGAYLMGLFALRDQVPGVVSAFNGTLVTGGDPVGNEVGNTAWNIVTRNIPVLNGLSYDQVNGFFNSSLSYQLAECRYDVTMHPVNTGLGIEGQKGEAYCDLNTGVHNGRATGAVVTPSQAGDDPVVMPDYSSGDQQNYYTPVILPGGGNGYALQGGSPTSSSTAQGGTGYGGNATANVQFESGIKGLTDRFLQEEPNWNKSWWSVFGVFKDNPASKLYNQYFEWLPANFLQFILDIGAIVFLVGAARFIRRG